MFSVSSWPRLPVRGQLRQRPLDLARTEQPVFEATTSTFRPKPVGRAPPKLPDAGVPVPSHFAVMKQPFVASSSRLGSDFHSRQISGQPVPR